MKKALNEINQVMKRDPYWISLHEGFAISNDGQSVIRLTFHNTDLSPLNSGILYIEDGTKLFHFLKDSKEISLAENFLCSENGNKYELTFVRSIPADLIISGNLSVSVIRGKQLKLLRGKVFVKESPLINDLVGLVKEKRKEVDNSFLFMEFNSESVTIVDSKTDLELKGKCLIAVNKFFPLKTKKRDLTEFLDFCYGKNLIVINYGNSEYTLSYTFNVLDIGEL